ncbi:hypothetical protein EMMF5_004826 [Cystobasidiomycetes sp. EMM_F5]
MSESASENATPAAGDMESHDSTHVEGEVIAKDGSAVASENLKKAVLASDSEDDRDVDGGGNDLFDLDAMLNQAMGATVNDQAMVTTEDLSQPHDSPSDSDDDDNQDFAFDLDAALQDAMAQSGQNDATEGSGIETGNLQPAYDEDHDVGRSEDEDDEDEDVGFDLDAAVAAAMQAPETGHGDSDRDMDQDDTDEDDQDDEQDFNLDEQIGAAMSNLVTDADGITDLEMPIDQLGDHTPLQSVDPGITSDELQAMLQSAMRQAQKEVALETEDQARARALDHDDFDIDFDSLVTPLAGTFNLPAKPKRRPQLVDDGDPDNAFNLSRRANSHALSVAYACDFGGCGYVFARPDNFQIHRATHNHTKPFECSTCRLRFTEPSHLRFHRRTHDPSRRWQYRCTSCHNLFTERAAFDAHLTSQYAQESCKLNQQCELQVLHPDAPGTGGEACATKVTALAGLAVHRGTFEPNNPPFFVKTPFSDAALFSATATEQLASNIARQYDRQAALLGPDDPPLDIAAALLSTVKKANLTQKETAALVVLLAGVAHARDGGLKASMEMARRTQLDVMRRVVKETHRQQEERVRSAHLYAAEAKRKTMLTQERHRKAAIAEQQRLAQLRKDQNKGATSTDGSRHSRATSPGSVPQSRQSSISNTGSEDIPVPQFLGGSLNHPGRSKMPNVGSFVSPYKTSRQSRFVDKANTDIIVPQMGP